MASRVVDHDTGLQLTAVDAPSRSREHNHLKPMFPAHPISGGLVRTPGAMT